MTLALYSRISRIAAAAAGTAALAFPALAADPFAEPERPPAGVYDGPVFQMSADWPAPPPPPEGLFPWQEAIGGGEITVGNAAAYAAELKKAVGPDMTVLLYDFANWDAAKAGWYNQPWIADIRDGIGGTYIGSGLPAAMFPVSGLKADMTTHVLVYYDTRAAGSLNKVWGETAMDPVPGLKAGDAQFAEGGLIVKPAFTTADASTWAPLEGAATWKLWGWETSDAKKKGVKSLFDVSLFQFDIIVKDTRSAPRSQWVYMTLVYDKDAPGETNWDKMVPLGVMWGNDPDVNSPMDCNYLPPDITCPELSETWINPDAPIYAKETLGWGGRLSGPNDGAVDINAAVLQPDGTNKPYNGRYAMSSCMGCHGAAEYEMQSFLLPSPAKCADDNCSPTVNDDGQLVYYPPGTTEFLRWFQDRPGYEPQDPGAIALDYGMNYAFKALPAWFAGTQQKGTYNFVRAFNDYRGLSPEHLDQD